MDSHCLEGKVKIQGIACPILFALASDLSSSLTSLSSVATLTHLFLLGHLRFLSLAGNTLSLSFQVANSYPSFLFAQFKCPFFKGIFPCPPTSRLSVSIFSCVPVLGLFAIFAIIKPFSQLLTECLTLSVHFQVPGGRISALRVYHGISRANPEPGHTEWCSVYACGINKIKKGFLYAAEVRISPNPELAQKSTWLCEIRARTRCQVHLPLQSHPLERHSLPAGDMLPTATRASIYSVPETLLGTNTWVHPSCKTLIQKERKK